MVKKFISLTDFMVSSSPGRMGRPRINAEGERITARFREGTLQRIKAILRGKEKQADFVRCAIEAALDAREAEAACHVRKEDGPQKPS